MESQEPAARRRRTKQPKKKPFTPFFKRRLKNVNITYFEITIFIVVGSLLLLGLFKNVIVQFLYDYFQLQ